MNALRRYFDFDRLQTDFRREILGGLTTFFTMAYIIIVNPAILEAAGIPRDASTTATILSAAFGTFLMAVYARRPFAVAPYMGGNAFVAFTVVQILGHSWQTALGAVFLSGVLFTLLTLFRVRAWLAQAVPRNLKFSFGVGIGLFLCFIGLGQMGLVVPGQGTPVRLGNLTAGTTLLGVAGLFLMAIGLIYRFNAIILIAILGVTILSMILGLSPSPAGPAEVFGAPPALTPIFAEMDVAAALHFSFFAVILTIFIMDFLDTMGTLIGVSLRAGLTDENGDLPEIEKPMLADALATVFASVCGTTTTGTYIESASGIEAGARSGFASLITAFMFLLALFLAPFFTKVPAHAYGPALVIVGLLMFSSVRQISMDDYTEFVPAFIVIILMSFTYDIGIGMTAGFVAYPVLKIAAGRAGEISRGSWVLGVLSLLFFLFYPGGKG